MEFGREGLRKGEEKKVETRVSFGNRGHRSDLVCRSKEKSDRERKKV